MSDATPEFVRRVAAAQATLDAFKDKPFKMGTRDCVRMTAHHLRAMGYCVRLPPSGAYASVRTALRELEKRGFADLAEALDGLGLERIPPAAAVAGDILMMPAEESIGALTIALGNGRVLGYHPEALGATTLQPTVFGAAWSVVPR